MFSRWLPKLSLRPYRKHQPAAPVLRRRVRIAVEQLEDRLAPANFFPVSVAGLIADINTANTNLQDDTIDLGGLTFTLAVADNPGNGLPIILADGGSSLTIANGTIERAAAAPSFRILLVGGGADLTLESVTITGGQTAASQNGGAIANDGTLTISRSTLSGNQAAIFGGAIVTGGSLLLRDSTISDNQAGLDGGGIYNSIGDLTIINSTVSGNTAVGSGGGISNSVGSTATLTSSIVAGNTAPTAPDFDGTPTTESFNLIGDNSGSGFAAGTPNTNNSFVGTSVTPINPLLGPLQNNGGPTETHALLPGSVAIDAGSNPLALATDQRGYVRSTGDGVDIGAVESNSGPLPPPALVVDTTVDENDGSYAPGDLSLREAIFLANLDPDANTITFDPALNGTTLVASLNDANFAFGPTAFVISSQVTIQGASSGPGITISGNNTHRIFGVMAGASLTLQNLTLTGGNATGGDGGSGASGGGGGGGLGGAVFNNGTLNVEQTTFVNNLAQGGTGGNYAGGGGAGGAGSSAFNGGNGSGASGGGGGGVRGPGGAGLGHREVPTRTTAMQGESQPVRSAAGAAVAIRAATVPAGLRRVRRTSAAAGVVAAAAPSLVTAAREASAAGAAAAVPARAAPVEASADLAAAAAAAFPVAAASSVAARGVIPAAAAAAVRDWAVPSSTIRAPPSQSRTPPSPTTPPWVAMAALALAVTMARPARVWAALSSTATAPSPSSTARSPATSWPAAAPMRAAPSPPSLRPSARPRSTSTTASSPTPPAATMSFRNSLAAPPPSTPTSTSSRPRATSAGVPSPTLTSVRPTPTWAA